jgi:uncharacterized protein (DUF342 family)
MADPADNVPSGSSSAAPVEPSEDIIAKRMTWLSRGLGVQVQRSSRRRAGAEAGLDANQWFYRVTSETVTLALREDCMKAYVIRVKPGANVSDVGDALKQINIAEPKIPPIPEIEAARDAGRWVLIAEGRPPRAEESVEFLEPGTEKHTVPEDTLVLTSPRLKSILGAGDLHLPEMDKMRAFAALPGEIVARVRRQGGAEEGQDVVGRAVLLPDNPPTLPAAGDHVRLEDGAYIANRYGYVLLEQGRLSLLCPLWLDPEAIRAYWCVLDRRPRAVSRDMMQPWIDDLGIIEGLDEKALEAAQGEVTRGTQTKPAVVVAEGTPPVHGSDTQLELLVDADREVGDVDEEGVIDFSNADFEPNAKPGQLIARLTPSTSGTDGRDLRGEVSSARHGADLAFDPGENVETRIEDGLAYYATAEGILKVSGRKLQVWEVLNVSGDVGFNTGNLDFRGAVVVRGSVRSGFKVKATGDVFVTGGIDQGAHVVTHGGVVVGVGISVRKTKVTCLDDVNAQFIHEATVQTARTIHVRNYTQGALLRASNVKVYKSGGQRAGSIVGGETCGLRSVESFTIGNPASLTTSVHAGMDLERLEKLEKLTAKIHNLNSQITTQLGRFNLDKLDVAQIKRLLSASSGPRQKVLARAAAQLGKMVQTQQELLKQKKDLESKSASFLGEAVVTARVAAYPNTKIAIGEAIRVLKDEIAAVRFRLRDGAIISD